MKRLEDPTRVEVQNALANIIIHHIERMLKEDIRYEQGKGPRVQGLYSRANHMEVVRCGHVVLEALAERKDGRDSFIVRKIKLGDETRDTGWARKSWWLPKFGPKMEYPLLGITKEFATSVLSWLK